MMPIPDRLAMIDLPEPAVVCVFSTCINRLPSGPAEAFCKLSVCRTLLKASTKICVAAKTAGKPA